MVHSDLNWSPVILGLDHKNIIGLIKHNLKFLNTMAHVLGTHAVTDTLSSVPLTEAASHSHMFIQSKFSLATIV